MGTVAGLRTRRYHGLLVVSGATAADRHLGLAALDPVLELPSGETVALATHEWASGAISPSGHVYLERFDLTDGVPRWRWRIGAVVIERELAMAAGAPAVGVVHRLLAGGPVRLRLGALCTWRDVHGERGAGNGELRVEQVDGGALVEDAYRLAGPGWTPGGDWYRGARLRAEAERGLNAQEDLWYAGSFVADLAVGEAAEVTAWAGGERPAPAGVLVAAARDRGRALVAGARDEIDGQLRLAADAFVIKGPDVVAGYPWFGAWSRDTMISYPGLFLATGRVDEGRALLRRYAGTLHRGLLANTADTGRVEYNTVDGTLWFVHAVAEHVRSTGDTDLAAELLPALAQIENAHRVGTLFGIRADPGDSLLCEGLPGYALTWMDARISESGVTPRIGKPVEVNALWINALHAVADLRERVGVEVGSARIRAQAATATFRARFRAPQGWLYDVLDSPGGDDAALRPNQLLAYCLPAGPLRGERPAAALDTALLTPLGLRTLAPHAPDYRGRHRGTPTQRDEAYHQGTVWPWLIGPYVDALRAAGAPTAGLLDGLEAHLSEYGLGSISETFDGDAPHGATGCPFQAWSVAEVLRVREPID